jgi:hypothetical protein
MMALEGKAQIELAFLTLYLQTPHPTLPWPAN